MFTRRLLVLRAGFAIVALSLVVEARPAGQAATALPLAKDIVAKHVTAVGGRAAQKAIKSVRVTGTLELVGQQVSGPVEVISARPNQLVSRVELKDVGHVESGYNGKFGWELDPLEGPSIAKGRKLTELADDAWFDGVLHESDHVREMTTVGREEFDKHQAYKLRVVFISGNEQFEYFDVTTGLQLGSEAQREIPMGVVPTTVVLREYQKFGKLMQPTVLIQRALGLEQRYHFATVEYDTVPPAAFDLPAVIKALIK